jgi:hypothetical protein
MKTMNKKIISFFKNILPKKRQKYVMDVTWKDIRAIFFPLEFHEKYKYLGCVPWETNSILFEAIEPLIIFMDHKVKPWWCPRWVLRFLHLFGSDNSIVRVRNRFLHNLERKITGGCLIYDYKTKQEWYDLRISITGTKQMQDLADAIEQRFYSDGYRKDLADRIKQLDLNTKYNSGYLTETLQKELKRLEKAKANLKNKWRLPTIEEFEKILYPNKDKIPNLKTNSDYWSSSECTNSLAWGFAFADGLAYYGSKLNALQVRAVRDVSSDSINSTIIGNLEVYNQDLDRMNWRKALAAINKLNKKQ